MHSQRGSSSTSDTKMAVTACTCYEHARTCTHAYIHKHADKCRHIHLHACIQKYQYMYANTSHVRKRIHPLGKRINKSKPWSEVGTQLRHKMLAGLGDSCTKQNCLRVCAEHVGGLREHVCYDDVMGIKQKQWHNNDDQPWRCAPLTDHAPGPGTWLPPSI